MYLGKREIYCYNI